MPLKVIIPKDLAFDPQRMERTINNGLDGAAKAAQVDFNVTTQTWDHDVEFTIEEAPGERIISTDDEIYGYVNDGTPAHIIEAKNGKSLAFGVPHKAKTAVRVIGSSAGSRGTTIVKRKRVRHPGTDAREFDETIAQKWRDLLPVTLQRSIDSEVS